jgi:exodeoxyribonuclease-3
MAPPLAIATWNVNSVRTRLEHVLKFLHSDYPDVLCLQELKTEEKGFPFDAFRSRGYNVAGAFQKTYNGVAIVSPYPLEDVAVGLTGDGPEAEQRCIAATVQGVRVVCVYVPNGQEVGTEKYAYKLAWMARLLKDLERRADPEAPLVLAGDFNVALDDRDVHDPKAWEGRVLFSQPEREAAGRWLAWGLSDTFRKHHREGGLYSWWDYRQGAFPKNQGLRIDHLWATRPLHERCVACDVLKEPRTWEQPSDHAPVVAVFAA